MMDRVCMARFASRGLSLTVSLLEVSWGQYHYLCFHFSKVEADIRKQYLDICLKETENFF